MDDSSRAWLLLDPEVLPEEWQHRAVNLALLPLMPGELEDVMGSKQVLRAVDPADEPLLRLLAQGLTAEAIARKLSITPRTVEKRLSRLREYFGVTSTTELSALLARRGL